MGVPIAAWPMHSDQPRNAMLVTEVLKIGVMVSEWSKREELVTGVQCRFQMGLYDYHVGTLTHLNASGEEPIEPGGKRGYY